MGETKYDVLMRDPEFRELLLKEIDAEIRRLETALTERRRLYAVWEKVTALGWILAPEEQWAKATEDQAAWAKDDNRGWWATAGKEDGSGELVETIDAAHTPANDWLPVVKSGWRTRCEALEAENAALKTEREPGSYSSSDRDVQPSAEAMCGKLCPGATADRLDFRCVLPAGHDGECSPK